jgi:hypothetical protein
MPSTRGDHLLYLYSCTIFASTFTALASTLKYAISPTSRTATSCAGCETSIKEKLWMQCIPT